MGFRKAEEAPDLCIFSYGNHGNPKNVKTLDIILLFEKKILSIGPDVIFYSFWTDLTYF